jgi:2,3-bisphosphoglycerate-independent phosphoglycerate mutase
MREIERALVIFLDGVGLGDDDPTFNPLAQADAPAMLRLLDGRRLVRANSGFGSAQASLVALDAQLGVPGLPQSGTGQTTLLTGINAAALLGQHDGPYPNRQLRDLLANGNLFRHLLTSGHAVAFANAYTDHFLSRIPRGTQRLSANARAALLAGLKLRGPDDLRNGRAVSSLLTNDYFRQQGYDVPDVSPEMAGVHLGHLASDHTLTYFEFWFTDVAGHRRNRELALHILIQLDRFIAGALSALDLSRCLVLVVSDHGNFEDLRTARHTQNPALALAVGACHNALASRLADLTDVTPTLLAALHGGVPEGPGFLGEETRA